MAGKTKPPAIDGLLKAVFDQVEAQPAPERLKAHVERLSGPSPTRKPKS